MNTELPLPATMLPVVVVIVTTLGCGQTRATGIAWLTGLLMAATWVAAPYGKEIVRGDCEETGIEAFCIVTPCGVAGGGPAVALPGTLIIFPDEIALAPGAIGTLICCDVGAKLTVCNGAAGKTVMRVLEPAGIRIALVCT